LKVLKIFFEKVRKAKLMLKPKKCQIRLQWTSSLDIP